MDDDTAWLQHKQRLQASTLWASAADSGRRELSLLPVPGLSAQQCVDAAHRAGWKARVTERVDCACRPTKLWGYDIPILFCTCPRIEYVTYMQ